MARTAAMQLGGIEVSHGDYGITGSMHARGVKVRHYPLTEESKCRSAFYILEFIGREGEEFCVYLDDAEVEALREALESAPSRPPGVA